MHLQFEQVARLAAPDDNVAIATQNIMPGMSITIEGQTVTLPFGVLEGHRFAIQQIHDGEFLLSWGQPFGRATADIMPGEYVCNGFVLDELSRRDLAFDIPRQPNFSDDIPPFQFDAVTFEPSTALPLHIGSRTFMGYPREGGRGVGTRNMIVLLGTTSLTSSFVQVLETRLKPLAEAYPNIDGIVAVAHTEGGTQTVNNRDLLLRTLAGFMVHPNVGAVLAVDLGTEAITNADLEQYMQENDYPLDAVPHSFMTHSGAFEDDLSHAEGIVRGWLEPVNAVAREETPISALKIALQCGGSDAFSGISGNPLVSWVVREVIRYGGAANLAETDELIGAERYTLDKVRDIETAKAFVATTERFQEWAGWHGHSALGNPSGGNLYRGLYNIYLKSLGAATKRHPQTRLDHVINYAQPMEEPGFYFMDSPGNDLESIAGQVAAGCNMIFFVTGNGSITNFPFVPTIKVVTTTARYDLLSNEMDVNAGAYLDGTPMDELGAETLDLTIAAASGERTAGERANHAQVQIWRDWQLTAPSQIETPKHMPGGEPIAIAQIDDVPSVQIPMLQTERGTVAECVGLILPTSLCSGQIARMCVEQLNKSPLVEMGQVSRFVTLMHTEGCGASTQEEFTDTLLGYLSHPMVSTALLLEHGCEKTHNAYIRALMNERGLNANDYGWASVQLDGGIQSVIGKMADWFTEQLEMLPASELVMVDWGDVSVGLLTDGAVSEQSASVLAALTQQIVSAGGTVVVPENDTLLTNPDYLYALQVTAQPAPSMRYAYPITDAGFHVMQNPTENWFEKLTGLGATGVDLLLAHVGQHPMPGNPMVPLLQVTDGALDVDAQIDDGVLVSRIIDTLARDYTPKAVAAGNVGFQVTRGLLGVSL